MVLNGHRNHEAYEGRGERGKRVWRLGNRKIIYLSLHCHVTTRMIPALRWAAMRAILMFQ